MNNKNLNYLPKLSIIIPNYNYGNFIEETICSVINQNYSNLELIIIDGGSTDHSIEIIKKYEDKIFYWISEKDGGQAEAINKGLAVATGDYVAYLNSDDTYLKNAFLNIFSNKMSLNKDFIYGDVLIGANIQKAKPVISNKNKLELTNLILFYHNAAYIIPSQSVFIKRDFLNSNGLNQLNPNLHYCMDLDWYCRISLHQPTKFKYKEIASFFRVNSNTKTISQSALMKMEALSVAFCYLKKLNNKQKTKFFKIRLFEQIFNKMNRQKQAPSFGLLIGIIIKSNFFSLSDRRFLGVLKSKFYSIV